MPDMELQTRYARTSDGVNIAWFAIGTGPPYIWTAIGGPSTADQWSLPGFREIIEMIVAHGLTLVLYDARGFGLSDRGPMDFSRDAMVRDLEAVADAAAPGRFVLQAFGPPSIPVIAYAHKHPERVRALVLLNGIICGKDLSASSRTLATLLEEDWETGITLMARSNEGSYASAATVELTEDIWRRKIPRDEFIALTKEIVEWDATAAAPAVTTPAIVVHYTNSLQVPLESSRRLTATMPNARLVSARAGEDGESRVDHVLSVVVGFLSEVLGQGRPEAAPRSSTLPSGTSIILFTDIVDSTPLMEQMGDAAFLTVSRRLDRSIRAAIREHGGTPVDGKVLGDGVMGVFRSAAQAIAAARECLALGEELPLHIGLHAGDVTSDGSNVYGGAVNIASRICGLCAPGEILVSDTVRGLARTSAGVAFEDRGEQTLKGIDDPVRVFAVRTIS